MARVGRPLGLITYDTERNQQCRATGRPLIYRLVRPRTLLYGLLLLVVAGAMLWSLMFRPTLDINVLQERNPLFVTLSDGDIRNGYTIKLLNKTLEARTFSLRLEGPPEAVMQVVGQPGDAHKRVLLAARPDSVATFRVYITLPQDALRGDSTPLAFVLSDDLRGEVAVHETAFRGPSR
jgi:polyferredoxin